MRRLLLLLLIALLPLQGLHAAAGSLRHAGGDFRHWVDHEQAVAHHHHDDQSVHYDDSDASERHVTQLDACHGMAVLPQAVRTAWLPDLAQAPPSFRSPFIGAPFLEGLSRPPHTLG